MTMTLTRVDEIPENDQLFIGSGIRSLRAERGLKQVDLARILQLDASVVALWEREQRPVPRVRVQPLAWALDVEVRELLEHARVVVGGYRVTPSRVEHVTETPTLPPPTTTANAPLRTAPLWLPRSTVELRWCRSDHDSGVCRWPGGMRSDLVMQSWGWHHHGPRGILVLAR